MKICTKIVLLLLGTACSFHQSSAATFTSDPIGQIRLTVKGTNGLGSSAVTVLGAPLENAIEAAGSLTAVAGTTLTTDSTTWTADALATTHYMQVTSGANAGISATIVGNTATVLTTAEDISSFLAVGDSFAIRPYTTLADVFGPANESGLDSGSTAEEADEVLIYNGSGFDIYYYQEGAGSGGDGWRKSTDVFTDQSGIPLPIGVCIIIKRKQVDDLNVSISGNVLATDSSIPVESGVNWISGAYPIEYTLQSYFGESGGDILKGATAEEADEILVPKDEGGFYIYYYQEGAAFGGDGYRSVTDAFTDVSGAVIAEIGKGFVLKRKGTGTSYNQTDRTPLSQ